ncbi:MAG: alpha/beta hydrolase-fold protein [Bdellovibrio sp.]
MVFFTNKLLLLHVSVWFLLVCIFLLIPTSAFSQTDPSQDLQTESNRYHCDSKKLESVGFDYCYSDLNTTNSDDIIYFFHPLNGSAETWFTQYVGTLMVQQWWFSKGYRPRVVTVSFGKEWLLVNNERYPFLRVFTNSIMPFLERKLGGLKNGRRKLIGESMGGFSAALLALKKPGLFSRVALLCPAITTISPFSNQGEIGRYIIRTNASPDLVDRMLKISRSIFVNKADFENHNPLTLVKNYRAKKRSKFYVSTGIWDGYGFQEGSEAFTRLARSKYFSSLWIPVPGWHCNFHRINAANFIMGD